MGVYRFFYFTFFGCFLTTHTVSIRTRRPNIDDDTASIEMFEDWMKSATWKGKKAVKDEEPTVPMKRRKLEKADDDDSPPLKETKNHDYASIVKASNKWSATIAAVRSKIKSGDKLSKPTVNALKDLAQQFETVRKACLSGSSSSKASDKNHLKDQVKQFTALDKEATKIMKKAKALAK
ncbi:unnamed protein product [Prorocentrum cordatum]|uniref:Uncharacterized protein n=1 Tax=Prorocentrum cordatum TaxID=2364126 RepID=A0ABN9RYT2_9DINO|nr:unnamed protein product [Polarella glacialis]